MYDKTIVASRIKELRINADITQEQLGQKLDMNKSTIQRYETAKVDKIKEPVIEKMAEILKTSSDFLLGKIDDPSPISKPDMPFDDFTYKMHDETKELTEEDKEALLNMARILKKKTETAKEKTNEYVDDLLENQRYTTSTTVSKPKEVRYVGKKDGTVKIAAYGGGVKTNKKKIRHT